MRRPINLLRGRLQRSLLTPREPFREPGAPEGWPQSFGASPAHFPYVTIAPKWSRLPPCRRVGSRGKRGTGGPDSLHRICAPDLVCRTVRPAPPAIGPFELITCGDELPVFAFKVKDDVENFTVFDVSNALRERGWQVPAYTFPKNREDLAALRVVVRRGFTHDMADMLLADMKRQLPRLERQPVPVHDEASASGFSH